MSVNDRRPMNRRPVDPEGVRVGERATRPSGPRRTPTGIEAIVHNRAVVGNVEESVGELRALVPAAGPPRPKAELPGRSRLPLNNEIL